MVPHIGSQRYDVLTDILKQGLFQRDTQLEKQILNSEAIYHPCRWDIVELLGNLALLEPRGPMGGQP